MEEGQTLEEDQAVAMSLEDKMAWRIQRRVRLELLYICLLCVLNFICCKIWLEIHQHG